MGRKSQNRKGGSTGEKTDANQAKPDGSVDPEYLQQSAQELYPDISRKAHFVPPAHINHVEFEEQKFPKPEHTSHVTVLVPKPTLDKMDKGRSQDGVQESSCRDDETHQRMLHCLHMIQETQPQAMFVISQLKFEDYLRYPPPDQSHQSPKRIKLSVPADLPERENHRGDFDILILSRDHGFLIIEIKAVGDLPENQTPAAITKKLEQSVKQLNKGRTVLQHLTKDKVPGPTIRSALAMPNVSESQLRGILEGNTELRKGLCRCLNIAETEDPVTYCLLADSMPHKDTPWQFKDEVKDKLFHWWRCVMGEKGAVPAQMADDEYRDLVSRFCGPATFPRPSTDTKFFRRSRSLGEAVADIGDRYSQLVLRPRQLGVLNTGGNLRFLCGPPGTGKTVLLTLRARAWLLDNRPVHVVSTWAGSLAASHHIAHELRAFCPQASDRVHVHQFDVKEEGDGPAVKALLAAAAATTTSPLCVICDEAFSGSEFADLCTQLKNNCTDLCLWAASVYHGYRPPCLEEETLAEPLRTPPAITREVARSDVIRQGLVHDYCACSTPLPSDGLLPIKIRHAAPGHLQGLPGDCVTCGEELGAQIIQLCAAHSPLGHRNFFILTCYYDLEDEVKDADGNVDRSASGLVQGLRHAGVPVTVLTRGDSPAIAQVAAMTGPDSVVVADADTVRGLERKVVVWVQAVKGGNSESGEMDFGRLDAVSRTTAQLIIVS